MMKNEINSKTFSVTKAKNGEVYRYRATVRFNDSCKNGHNTFAITCDTYKQIRGVSYWVEVSGGADHESVRKHLVSKYPFLEEAVNLHLVSTDQPSHYIANTLYHVGDKETRY